MTESEQLAERFERHRAHLRTVAYGMLGSLNEVDDAVQEAWVRLNRTGARGVENLGGWLTMVVARVCLDMLRSRKLRCEEPMGFYLPEPVVTSVEGGDPEQEALLADSVGLAMLVVLETLTPAERLAYVLHDMFGVPFEKIAPLVGRSPAAARQQASRARRRIKSMAPEPERDLSRQRTAVDAFFAAARAGDFERLLTLLHPEVVLRADHDPAAVVPSGATEVHGARTVARKALFFSPLVPHTHPVLVNGDVGALVAPRGEPFSLMAFTVHAGRIVEICVYADRDRLRRLGITSPSILGGADHQEEMQGPSPVRR
ncbi:sigma-70 family RNA polymerase sigma factor [Actinomadura soli]|uniref:Sigma-70 family RNA polymerase sigma factor n=1 Tax=Actinomadura soli TaxID=2508997 RepID=A0A5C4J516_9ACTN|nr:sigma-70 family RNA polymerase sigma factor [Actinomadura soli]TMQ91582.1 sigma-70 family RNA polymerase sigma factor [Actinomadura soli]